MTAERGFQCPACGADFDVQERLEDEEDQQTEHGHGAGESKETPPAQATSSPRTVTCPNCGTEVSAEEASRRRQP